MSGVEEIEAAIARLTELREAATPGHWVLSQYDDVVQSFESAKQTNVHEYERDGIIHESQIRHADALLIVTLHRTIDAQLAILHSVKSMLKPFHGIILSDEAVELELALARAINGTTKGD